MRVESHKPFDGWQDYLKDNPDKERMDTLRAYSSVVETTSEQDEFCIKAAEETLKSDETQQVNKGALYRKLNRDTVKNIFNTISDVMVEHNLHAVRCKLAALPIDLIYKPDEIIIYDDTSLQYVSNDVHVPGMYIELDLRTPEERSKKVQELIEKIKNYKYIDYSKKDKTEELITKFEANELDNVKIAEAEEFLKDVEEDKHPPEFWSELPF